MCQNGGGCAVDTVLGALAGIFLSEGLLAADSF